MEWAGAQIALGRDPFCRDACLSGPNGNPLKVACARQKAFDLLRSFLGLQRARAIDEPAARLHEPRGILEQSCLESSEPLEVALPLQMQNVGVTPDRARRQARRVEQHGVEAGARLPFRCIRLDDLRLETQPCQVSLQPLDPAGIDLNSRDPRTTNYELGRLAARRRA